MSERERERGRERRKEEKEKERERVRKKARESASDTDRMRAYVNVSVYADWCLCVYVYPSLWVVVRKWVSWRFVRSFSASCRFITSPPYSVSQVSYTYIVSQMLAYILMYYNMDDIMCVCYRTASL